MTLRAGATGTRSATDRALRFASRRRTGGFRALRPRRVGVVSAACRFRVAGACDFSPVKRTSLCRRTFRGPKSGPPNRSRRPSLLPCLLTLHHPPADMASALCQGACDPRSRSGDRRVAAMAPTRLASAISRDRGRSWCRRRVLQCLRCRNEVTRGGDVPAVVDRSGKRSGGSRLARCAWSSTDATS
jgi:hypothetical protein